MDYSRTFSSIIKGIKAKIDSPEYLDNHRICNLFTRKRKLDFKTLMYFLINNGKLSIANNASNFKDLFPFINFPNISKQAISKSRQGIDCLAFKELFNLSVEKMYKYTSKLNKYHGYNVLAVDGTTIQVAPTDENSTTFGYNPNNTGFTEALASASMLYDILNDYIVDAKITDYRYSERKSAVEHLDSLKNLSFPKKTILVFDRGYPSCEMFKAINDAGYYFIMRTPKVFKQISNNISLDSAIEYKSKGNNNTITLRAIKIRLLNGNIEYITTNLLDEDFYIEDFKELYSLRWGIESKYKELKSQLQLKNFSGSKPLTIRQDFYITMLYANLVSLIKSDIDLTNISSFENSCMYQSNRGFIIKKLRNTLVSLIFHIAVANKVVMNIIIEAYKNKSVIRPMRKFIRRKRQTSKKYYINSKLCIIYNFLS